MSDTELWVCELGVVEYREALALQERVRAARQAERGPGHAAPARAPAGLHARAPVARGRAAVRRGLVPRAGDRHRRRRPRRQADLPRPRPARRLSDHADRRRHRLHPHDRAGDRRRARRRGDRGARAARRRARLHGRLDAGAQDRVDRRARGARRDDPRLRGQRRQRPRAVSVGRRLRPRRREHDVGARGGPGDRRPAMPAFRAAVAEQFATAFGRDAHTVTLDRLDAALVAS